MRTAALGHSDRPHICRYGNVSQRTYHRCSKFMTMKSRYDSSLYGMYGAGVPKRNNNAKKDSHMSEVASGSSDHVGMHGKVDMIDSNNVDSVPKSDPCSTSSRRAVLAGMQSLWWVGGAHAMAGRGIGSVDVAGESFMVKDIEKRLEDTVSEFTLDNGMKFIVRERRNAPICSFHTYADVGAFDEDGLTGIAHLLEHLAFKGSPRGSLDYKRESDLLDAMDEVFMESLAASSKKKANVLKDRLDAMQTEASQLAMSNAFGALLMREGAVGLNAATSHDSTKYYCSMPSNKIELWFALEAERFQAPVFRDVYSEKKVVLEERRLRVDSSPLGRFQEKFAEESLTNNYRRPVIGYEEDIERIGRRDVASFFKDKYGPESLTVAIVGDVSPSKIRQYAEKYFGGWRREVTRTARCNGYEQEPLAAPVDGRSRVMTASSKAGPLLVRAWYRPCIRNQSASLALDAMDDFLTGSRSSRTYRNLVEKSTALSVSTYATFPGEKHATQMLCYAIPAPGVSLDTLDTSLQREVECLLEKGPSEEELSQYKKVCMQVGCHVEIEKDFHVLFLLASEF